MDFTPGTYISLIVSLKDAGYEFVTYSDYCSGNLKDRFVIMRHDVDKKPANSLAFAREENRLGVRSSYYFRAVPESWDEDIIKAIAELGHEVGYHYESLTTCHGDVDAAYADFCRNLEALRRLTPVSTICMHGSPRSPYDSKDIWQKYDYRELGVLGEPYLSTDFSQVLYLTDTGRRWDGHKVSVRDRVNLYQDRWNRSGWSFHSTGDILEALKHNALPDKLMITTHPQRWNAFGIKWVTELLVQNAKNIIKARIVKKQRYV